MKEHDEALFQRINKARVKHVGDLRLVLNSAGLHEKGTPVYNSLGIGQQGFQNQTYADGYDIEKIIQFAVNLRNVLAPFDTTLPETE
jgi:hypothetical protein